MPHQKEVIGVIFQPTSGDTSLCVSGSKDGKFKMWEEIDNSDIYGLYFFSIFVFYKVYMIYIEKYLGFYFGVIWR